MGNNRIYLSPPHMSGKEIEFVQDAFKSNWIAPLGPYVNKFEKDIESYPVLKPTILLSAPLLPFLQLQIRFYIKMQLPYLSTAN